MAVALVVDSSVAVKWCVDELGSRAAIQLIGEPLIAPDIILAEVANALWKKHLRGEVQADHAAASLSAVSQFVNVVPSASLAGDAFALSVTLSHPVYDCFFLALAEQLDLELVSEDQRFIRSCAGTSYARRVRRLQPNVS